MTAIVVKPPTETTIVSVGEIGPPGAQGPAGPPGAQGPAGPPGPAGGNLFVQNSAPVSPPATYAWFQTGLGTGTDITLWIEDNLP